MLSDSEDLLYRNNEVISLVKWSVCVWERDQCGFAEGLRAMVRAAGF